MNPVMWTAIILILYVTFTLLVRIPVLGVVLVLLFPTILVGLMQGCRHLEAGESLRITHLLTGFQKNAAYLVTVGGISLVGNLLLLMLFATMSGDAVMVIMKHAESGNVDPAAAETVLRAAPKVITAALLVMAISLPLLMGLWFAPLLVYFDDRRCAPSSVSGLAGRIPCRSWSIASSCSWALGVDANCHRPAPDRLGFWPLAPILIPSIYAS
jgi:hypothetical protein